MSELATVVPRFGSDGFHGRRFFRPRAFEYSHKAGYEERSVDDKEGGRWARWMSQYRCEEVDGLNIGRIDETPGSMRVSPKIDTLPLLIICFEFYTTVHELQHSIILGTTVQL